MNTRGFGEEQMSSLLCQKYPVWTRETKLSMLAIWIYLIGKIGVHNSFNYLTDDVIILTALIGRFFSRQVHGCRAFRWEQRWRISGCYAVSAGVQLTGLSFLELLPSYSDRSHLISSFLGLNHQHAIPSSSMAQTRRALTPTLLFTSSRPCLANNCSCLAYIRRPSTV